MRNQSHLLRSRRFLPLFVTQFFGAFNDNAFKNALLIWYAYDMSERTGISAANMLTLAAGLFILPFFLLSATAGQLADKYSRPWLTQKIKQAEIILMLAGSVFFYLESVGGLLTVLCLMGAQSAFFGPIKYSLLPEHLEEDELISGNALIEGGTFISILLGTLFGGLIIRSEHGLLYISMTVVGFALIGWLASRRIPAARIADPSLSIDWNIFRETVKITGFARQNRSVWLAILGISWFWFLGVTFLTQFPVYTQEIIHGDESIVTFFLTLFSVGIGIGSLACNRLLKGQIDGRLVPVGALGMAIASGLFAYASYDYRPEGGEALIGLMEFLTGDLYGWAISLSLLALAIFGGLYIVPLYAIMQHRGEAQHLSRIIAANNILNAAFMVGASFFALGLFVAGLDVTQVLLITGLLNIPIYWVIRKIVRSRLES